MARPKEIYKLTPEALKSAWDEYVTKCDAETTIVVSAGKKLVIPKPRVYTVEEFCVFAGIHRDTFYTYDKIEDFSDTTKRILAAVFARKQSALVNGEGNTTGLIFDMKANYGVNEKTYIEHSGKLEFNAEHVETSDLAILERILNGLKKDDA